VVARPKKKAETKGKRPLIIQCPPKRLRRRRLLRGQRIAGGMEKGGVGSAGGVTEEGVMHV